MINHNIKATGNKSSSRMIECYAIIWLDSNIDESDRHYQNMISQFQRIADRIKTFTNPDQCIEYLLTVIEDLKISLILSHTFCQHVLSLIHHLSQLDSIYILCHEKIPWKDEIKQWTKIRHVFNDISLIYNQLKEHHRQRDQTIISIITPSSTKDFNQVNSTFMYSKLLAEILVKIEHDNKAKKDLIEFYRNHIRSNVINEFEEDYERYSPIWWYTKEPLIYTILNRALRTQDIQIIIKMAFFLRDLHRQIEQLHLQSVNKTAFTVYRGQGISNIELEKMKMSKHALLSFNHFLSTSLDRDVSLTFAHSSRNDCDLMGILFEMKIDPLLSTTPFALLDQLSHYPNEKEVLFSMHTVFRIEHLIEIEHRLWQVNLTLTKDNDEQLACLTERMREEIGGETGWHQLGFLMNTMGQYDQAEEIYQTLLETKLENELEKAVSLHREFGRALLMKGNLSGALSNYERAIEIQEKYLPANYLELATTYIGLGFVNCSMGNYFIALSHVLKALEIQEKSLTIDHQQLANIQNDIGWMHYLLGDYSNAFRFCEKAMKIGEEFFLLNHPKLAYIYDSMGRIYYSMGDNSNALSYYTKAFEIQQASMPSTHPHIATSYCHIGEVHHSMKDYTSALSYYEKTLQIREKSFLSYHPELAYIYNKMGELYYSMEDNSTALSYYEKAVNIQEKLTSSNSPDLAITYGNFGLVYQSTGDHSTALSFHEKALEMQQKALPLDHPQLAATHFNMSVTLEDLHRYQDAIEHGRRAEEIVTAKFQSDHPQVQKYQSHLYKLREKQ